VLALSSALLVILPNCWWLPRFDIQASALVVAGLLGIGALAVIDLRLGAAMAFLLMLAVAVASPPELHLWGDGSLRLRNLEAGIGVLKAAPFEPGDHLLHRLLMDLGLTARQSFQAGGLAGGALYLFGLLLILGGPRRGVTQACRMVLALSPTLVVFFAGYVESYSIVAGLLALSAGLIISERHPSLVLLCAATATMVHSMGLILLPGAILYSAARGERNWAIAGSAALLACGCALFLVLRQPSTTAGLVQLPGFVRLELAVFASPALLLAIPAVRGRPAFSQTITALLFLAAFLAIRLERGERVDWDLGATLLLPCLLALLPVLSGRPSVLLPLAVAGAVLAGPRIGSFLDPAVSEARYLTYLETSEDPAAFEEMAILMRDRGRYDDAADLFEQAWARSGNGRHLSQMSEALRLAGNPVAALEAARSAAALRPGVETIWLQMAVAARDAGSARDAFTAAAMYDSLFPGAGSLWSYALEAALAAGDSTLALRAAELSLSDGDTLPEELINAAGAALMADSDALAERLLLAASAMAPGNPLPPFDLALIALDRGDTSSAISFLERALEVAPDFEQAGNLLATLQLRIR
jgi:tetratricopeptide (TPR) repeat protein